jgi:hypothetical protein
MKIETFEKQLLKALKEPEQWHLYLGWLRHKTTGIRMLTSSIENKWRIGVLVTNDEDDHLTSVDGEMARGCLAAVKARGDRLQANYYVKQGQEFIRKFKGFK